MKRTGGLSLSGLLIVASLLLFQWSTSASDKASNTVTFAKDVAPILYKNCAACHRAGEVAPMSLLSYKEARPWARSIREVVAERRMPPWLADPHFGEFSNDRRLSQQEIDTIVAWVDGGAKEGDAKDLPPAPKFSDVGWKFGNPDVILPMTVEATVPADGVVAYRHFVVPTNFTEDKYVQLAEIKRGDPSVVHHVIVSVR
jgi:mono/diheme cytochrome c family protein